MTIPAGFGKLRGAPEVPTKVLVDLIAAGAIDPNIVHLPPPERCRCIHVPGAHEGGTGPCQAKPCRKFKLCAKYEQDPRYSLPVPNVANVKRRRLPVRYVDAPA
jgi:hypothetical protein